MKTTISKYLISQDVAFQDRLDETDPFAAPMEDLQRLIDDAPAEFEQGYLSGVFAFRQQLEAMAIFGSSH